MPREYDSEGIPLDELFTNKEMAHLRFEKWRNEKACEITTPQTPLPDFQTHLVNTADPRSVGQFLDRHKRKGAYKRNA